MNSLMCISYRSINKFHILQPYRTLFRKRCKCLRCNKVLNEEQLNQYNVEKWLQG